MDVTVPEKSIFEECSQKSSEEPQPKKFKSEVWNHFTIEEDGMSANCNYCKTIYKLTKGKGSTGNMGYHLQKNHPRKLPTVPPTNERSVLSMLKDQAKQKASEFNHKMFREYLLKWVVLSNQPFLEAESPEFRDFVSYLRPEAVLPCANTVQSDLIAAYTREKLNIMKVLQGIGKFSLGLDCWTSPNQIPFLGVTIHWIDAEWRPRTQLLEFKHIEGRHTGPILGATVIAILKDYGLCLENTFGITCDNASNNDTLMEHLDKQARDGRLVFASENSRIRCFAHILNLCAQDLLKSLKAEQPIDEEYNENQNADLTEIGLSKTISQVRTLMKKIKYSHTLRESLHQLCDQFSTTKLQPMLDVVTRWNSTNDMLSRAEALKGPLNSLCASEKCLEHLMITESQWEDLRKLKTILQKFQIATLRCSKESATISEIIPIYNWLHDSLKEFQENHSGLLCDAAYAAQLKLEKYRPDIDTSPTLFVATATDPRYKITYFKDHGYENRIIKKIKENLSANYKQYTENQQATPARVASDENDVADEFESHAHKNTNKRTCSELTRFLNANCEHSKLDVYSWWRANSEKFPTLSKMAKDFLTAKPKSVPIEREFAGGVDLVCPTRGRLAPKSITACMTLKSWWKTSGRRDENED